jgi:hypothetical protein
VMLYNVFLPVFQFSSVSIIPPVLHNHLFIHLPPRVYNVLLPVLLFGPVIIILPVLHTHSLVCHQHYTILAANSVVKKKHIWKVILFFSSILYQWTLILPAHSALKRAVDTLLCSMCYIKPALFPTLLQRMGVLVPNLATHHNASISDDR